MKSSLSWHELKTRESYMNLVAHCVKLPGFCAAIHQKANERKESKEIRRENWNGVSASKSTGLLALFYFTAGQTSSTLSCVSVSPPGIRVRAHSFISSQPHNP
jgi:hypothetical protein